MVLIVYLAKWNRKICAQRSKMMSVSETCFVITHSVSYFLINRFSEITFLSGRLKNGAEYVDACLEAYEKKYQERLVKKLCLILLQKNER